MTDEEAPKYPCLKCGKKKDIHEFDKLDVFNGQNCRSCESKTKGGSG